jgi:DNA-formamidopyrimidine glycosylase
MGKYNMPEGPELKLSANLIKPLIVGRKIKVLDFPTTSRYYFNSPDGLIAFIADDKKNKSEIQNINVKGKFMYWTINDWYMFITYGMTGQFAPKAGKHVCMGLTLQDDVSNDISNIYFNDPRHFGTIKFVNGEVNLKKKLAELGWDPLSGDLADYGYAMRKVYVSNKPIGQLLMDQKLFAGVGNYIRAEALYQVQMSPWRPGSSINREEMIKLFDALAEVMKISYQHQGATIQTYVTPYGEEGKYSSCFKVYGQKQDPLGNPIKKETTPEGRTIHWCPTIQH